MKKYTLIIVFILFLQSCSDDLGRSELDIAKVHFSNESKSRFIELTKQLSNLLLEDISQKKKNNLKNKLKRVSSEGEFLLAIKSYVKEPKQFLSLLKEQYSIYNSDWRNEFQFVKLSERQKIEFIEAELLRFSDLDTFNNLMNGKCESELEKALERCHVAAGIGTVYCGWFTITIWGALGCAAVVIIENEYCHKWANEDYIDCLSQNKDF